MAAYPYFVRSNLRFGNGVASSSHDSQVKESRKRLAAFQPAASAVARISIKVQPCSANDRIVGESNGEWKIAVTAPPVEGRANAAVIELLSHCFAVPRSAFKIVRGEKSCRKVIEVSGISAELAGQRLAAAK